VGCWNFATGETSYDTSFQLSLVQLLDGTDVIHRFGDFWNEDEVEQRGLMKEGFAGVSVVCVGRGR
jgi:hypothetical protein